MSVEFTYSEGRSYRDYLAALHSKERIEIVVPSVLREAVATLKEIFSHDPTGLSESFRDIRRVRVGTQFQSEVVTLNLFHAMSAAGSGTADAVTAFQALFLDGATQDVGRSPLAAIDTAADTRLVSALSHLHEERYADALRVLSPAGKDDDFRLHYLRGVLRGGIPGQPKSAVCLDLEAADAAFAAAAASAPTSREAALCHVAAGKVSYAAGRLHEAGHHFREALALAPREGEPNYQLARLCRHSGNADGMRVFLVRAFDIHFSYAMRAMSDAVFTACPDVVGESIENARRVALRDIRASIRKTCGDAMFLIDLGSELGLARLGDVSELLQTVKRVGEEPEPATLKAAHGLRDHLRRSRQPIADIASGQRTEMTVDEAGVIKRLLAHAPVRARQVVRRDVGLAVDRAVCGLALVACLCALRLGHAWTFCQRWPVMAALLGAMFASFAVLPWLLRPAKRPGRRLVALRRRRLTADVNGLLAGFAARRVSSRTEKLHARIKRRVAELERRFPEPAV